MSQLSITEEYARSTVIALLEDGNKRGAAKILWPWIVPNPYRGQIYDDLDAHDFVAIMGHGSASKTFTCVEYFLLDWWTDPQNTALVITSDTLGSMDRRIWSDVKTLWSKTAITMPGVLIDSKRMIVYNHMDKKNAIAGMAAEHSDSQTKIQGLHCKNIRFIIDEADNPYSQSIWMALSNLGTSGNMKGVALANPVNRQSEFGQHAEPVNGWTSLNHAVDSAWMSKKKWWTRWFDGLRSPNIVAEKDEFPFLLTKKGVQDVREGKGETSLEWWSYIRGMYSPQGDQRTIFSPDILVSCRKPLVWYTTTQPIAACDPALEEGGDNCVLGLGIMGHLAHDIKKVGFKLEKSIKIHRKDMSVPASIDKANQIIAICKQHGVEPDHFAIDCTGEGRAVSDHIKFAWNPGKTAPTLDLRFGQGATEQTLTTDSTKKACELYDRFVSELWYGAREWCKLGLVWIPEGLPQELTVDLESRLYGLVGGKDLISIETKREYKKRTKLLSPDHGDMFCVLAYLVRYLARNFKPGLIATPIVKNSLARFKKLGYVGNASYGVKA